MFLNFMSGKFQLEFNILIVYIIMLLIFLWIFSLSDKKEKPKKKAPAPVANEKPVEKPKEEKAPRTIVRKIKYVEEKVPENYMANRFVQEAAGPVYEKDKNPTASAATSIVSASEIASQSTAPVQKSENKSVKDFLNELETSREQSLVSEFYGLSPQMKAFIVSKYMER